MAKKNSIKIKARLNFANSSKDIEVNKVSEINLSNNDRQFFYLEKNGGVWILNYTKSLVPELNDFIGIEIVGESYIDQGIKQ